jgi:Uma2 family endonuclease
MAIETKLITAEELFQMPDNGQVTELVDGEVRTMTPAGYEHADIAMLIGESLSAYAKERQLGRAFASEIGFVISRNPDTVRAPDVAFVRKERLRRTPFYFEGPPDLAVEVISPNDIYTEVDEKVEDWLHAGVRIVIVINPRKQTAVIHRSLTQVSHIDIDGALDAGDVVPGWTLSLRDLFVS